MNDEQKRKLINLNNEFYRKTAKYFSATRQSFWPGWEKLPCPNEGDKVLDVASGNLRFKKFLDGKINQYQYLGVDACEQLPEKNELMSGNFIKLDILAAMLEASDWTDKLPRHEWNYVFCCAFLHHIPSWEWQIKFLKKLSDLVAVNGILVVNFWQFLTEPKMKNKIITNLGNNDYILAWNEGVKAQRYCHNFTKEEIMAIKAQMQGKNWQLIREYQADGTNQKMNYYLGWRKLDNRNLK